MHVKTKEDLLIQESYFTKCFVIIATGAEETSLSRGSLSHFCCLCIASTLQFKNHY